MELNEQHASEELISKGFYNIEKLKQSGNYSALKTFGRITMKILLYKVGENSFEIKGISTKQPQNG